MKVRLAGIINESVSDGPGLRIVLFFQGCQHHCPGCHNPHTWDPAAGIEYEIHDLLNMLRLTQLIQGVTLSGGDPFFQPAPAAVIAREFHERGKDVWAYTGFIWEDLLRRDDAGIRELIHDCDVIVDGPFIRSLRSYDLPYRSTSNQRLIEVKNSLQSGKVVFHQGIDP